METRKLDMTTAWQDAMRSLASNMQAVVAIAGVFLFLPPVITAVITAGYPVPDTEGLTDFGQLMQVFSDWWSQYLADFWWLMLIATILGWIGALSINALILAPEKPTVGQSLSIAIGLLFFYFVAELMSGLAIGLGTLFFIIPGIYLAIKFSLVAPSMVAENIRSPFAALGRSWNVTKGNSLRMLAMLLIIGIVGAIILVIIGAITGLVFGNDASGLGLVTIIINQVMGTGFSVIILFVLIAIYRQLTDITQVRETPDSIDRGTPARTI